MFKLEQPRLLNLAKQAERSRSRLRYLDLQAAQSLAQQYAERSGENFWQLPTSLVDLLVLCSACHVIGAQALCLGEVEGYERLGLRWLGEAEQAQAVQALKITGLLVEAASESESESDALKPQASLSPLVLHAGHVYLRRVWRLKAELEAWFAERQQSCLSVNVAEPSESCSSQRDLLTGLITSLFAHSDATETCIDFQALAAAQALTQPLCLISGGPGTGKTTTAARMLLLSLVQRGMRLGFHTVTEQQSMPAPLLVKLLAPTGKAAVRLYSSILAQFQALLAKTDFSARQQAWLQACLPEAGETIHRALVDIDAMARNDELAPNMQRLLKGYRDSNDILLGQRSQRLAADIVLIDEASMIDLKLMHDLVSHLPSTGSDSEGAIENKGCQLLVMGDPYQLAPVEIGEVFAEWVAQAQVQPYADAQVQRLGELMQGLLPSAALAASLDALKVAESSVGKRDQGSEAWRLLCELSKTYRFSGPIYDFAQQLRSQQPLDLATLLPHEQGVARMSRLPDLLSEAELTWFDLGLAQHASKQAELNQELENCLRGYQAYFDCLAGFDSGASMGAGVQDLAQALAKAKAGFQILCAGYDGPLGVHRLNQLIEQIFAGGRELYHGKVIMVTENQSELGLFNGDIGFLLDAQHVSQDTGAQGREKGRANTREQQYVAVFPDKAERYRDCAFSLIKAWQSAYAISIHKSQGSEYRHVAMFVPDYARELLSRRLVYTGLTRSQNQVQLWLSRDSLENLS